MNPVYTAANVPTGTAPSIASFGASSTAISAGQSLTLSWNVSGASYSIIAPIGPVRGTPYTLTATNAFGRTQKTVTVTVQ